MKLVGWDELSFRTFLYKNLGGEFFLEYLQTSVRTVEEGVSDRFLGIGLRTGDGWRVDMHENNQGLRGGKCRVFGCRNEVVGKRFGMGYVFWGMGNLDRSGDV